MHVEGFTLHWTHPNYITLAIQRGHKRVKQPLKTLPTLEVFWGYKQGQNGQCLALLDRWMARKGCSQPQYELEMPEFNRFPGNLEIQGI